MFYIPLPLLLDTAVQNVLIGLIIALVILIVLGVIYYRHARHKSTKVVKGVKYSNDKNEESRQDSIQYHVGDVLLKVGVVNTVSKENKLLPGKYTVYSGDSNQRHFFLKINGVNKDFVHESALVLAEGETIEAINGSVILR
jgi:H+/gluconate symporter-like permease